MNNDKNTYKSLRTFIEANKVISFNSVKTKKEIFSQIENLLLSNTSFNKNELAKYLLKLENKNPTDIGNGIAIPNMQDLNIKKVCGCFIRLKNSIMYDSYKNEPVDLFLVLLSPLAFSKNHLKLLAQISRLLINLDIQNKLRGAINDEALFEILTQPEFK